MAVTSIVTAWVVVTELRVWPELILPRPISVWGRFVESITIEGRRRGIEGSFLWEHLAASGLRLAIGLAIAVVVGVPLGLMMATVAPFRRAIEPLVSFVRSLPPLAYFSLLIIWFGIDDTSKVWLLAIASIAPIALAVVSGAEATRPEWIDAARTLGASRLAVIRFTIVPSLLPEFFTGLRLAVGFALTTIVAAETVNGIPGIGGLAWSTKKFNQTDVAIMCVIVIGLAAVVIDGGIRAIERRAVPWKGRV